MKGILGKENTRMARKSTMKIVMGIGAKGNIKMETKSTSKIVVDIGLKEYTKMVNGSITKIVKELFEITDQKKDLVWVRRLRLKE